MISVCKCLLIEQTFTKWTSSLSSILSSHRFNYLLDDPVYLPVDFVSTQASSILECKQLAPKKVWILYPQTQIYSRMKREKKKITRGPDQTHANKPLKELESLVYYDVWFDEKKLLYRFCMRNYHSI